MTRVSTPQRNPVVDWGEICARAEMGIADDDVPGQLNSAKNARRGRSALAFLPMPVT